MADHAAAFAGLRTIMLAAAAGLVVTRDEPGDVVVRTAAIDPGTGEPGWFGTVTVKKSYVAYHLIPLYAAPSPGVDRARRASTSPGWMQPCSPNSPR